MLRVFLLIFGLTIAAACSTAPTALPQDFDPNFAF